MSQLVEGLLGQWRNGSIAGSIVDSPAILAAVAFIAGAYYYSSRPRANEPPRVGYTIPVVGHGIEFAKNPAQFFAKCTEQYGETFSMLMFGRWITVIGRSEIRNVMRAPDNQFSFTDGAIEMLDTVYMFGDTLPGNRFHVTLLRRNLAKQLDQLAVRMVGRAGIAYRASIGAADKPVQLDDIGMFIDDVVARMMSTCLTDNEDIYNNDEVLRMMRTVARDVARTTLFKRMFPLSISRLLTRQVTAMSKNLKVADEIIAPEVAERRRLAKELGDAYNEPHDMLNWINNAKDDNGDYYDPIAVARRSIQIAFASVTTTSNFCTHFIYDIASYPEYRKKLQEEQDELVHLYGEEITPEALQKMRFMDACIRESLRLNSSASK
ncbi:cytochrome P450 [Syncephalis pseudoplumigaleata]|uniref:Cytochrome P450 n=1 Tax=Syncephalis pseudoplumigaleata TaxID=1712513 RepID=A0A4P9Z454_9FUNG|nr:cytochrome P450 [Syncephalis pseudoplumigaleata]|eukprot:RKP27343.1 cytochrome P450 [Syncephalis pseudoplumigaleata]